jgi:hypothetical protein
MFVTRSWLRKQRLELVNLMKYERTHVLLQNLTALTIPPSRDQTATEWRIEGRHVLR